MESIKTLYRFWFKEGSPVTFGVFRAIMGGLIFIAFMMIGCYFFDWFPEFGYHPSWQGAQVLDKDVFLTSTGSLRLPRIDLIYGITDIRVLMGFYVVLLVSALFTCLGLFSRISSIVLALCVISFCHRYSALLAGYDTVMRVCAIYLAVGPAGAAFSLDRFFAVRAGKAPIIPPLVSMWPQRLVAYNCCLVYFTTTWAKWFGGLWKSGAATWYPARLHEFDRFPVPDFLNQFPVVRIATYSTLLVEFALGTLVWFKPLRKWVLLAGIGMHAYIDYTMNVPLFAYLMVSMYISYYEGEEVAAWFDRIKARFGKNAIPEPV